MRYKCIGDLYTEGNRLEKQQELLKILKKFQDDFQQLRVYPPKNFTFAE